MRSTWASTSCTRARRCGRSWYSDVTPFDYMKAMAELWGRGGQDFAAAQQNFFANMAKAGGQEVASELPPAGVFDPQGPEAGEPGIRETVVVGDRNVADNQP